MTFEASCERVMDFMRYFEQRYNLTPFGTASRIMAIPAAHHRLNYIHPFPDGNGRVSRLMSHAMAHQTGIGTHGQSRVVQLAALRVAASTSARWTWPICRDRETWTDEEPLPKSPEGVCAVVPWSLPRSSSVHVGTVRLE